ncbi:MAG: hypothetical protein ACRENI_05715 [Gemmatimonadaceae bacterium]
MQGVVLALCTLLLTIGCGGDAPPPPRPQEREAGTPGDTLPNTDTAGDTLDPGALTVGVITVNTGSRGMAARTRWALSPDRRTVIAVEDPTAVENEPEPNGFVFATEHVAQSIRVDSVWDVAPSPDWRSVAFGRAFTVMVRGAGDEVTPPQWRDLAERAGLSVDSARAAAFESSSMNIAFGLARPAIATFTRNAGAGAGTESGETRAIAVAGGWRVRWSSDGETLALGRSPMYRTDDAPPSSWMAVDVARGVALGELPAATVLDSVQWIEGPVLDISIPIDMATTRTIATDNGPVESSGGRIRSRGRVIGPGVAVAATRGGMYIVALTPRPDRAEFETPTQLTVYTVMP